MNVINRQTDTQPSNETIILDSLQRRFLATILTSGSVTSRELISVLKDDEGFQDFNVTDNFTVARFGKWK